MSNTFTRILKYLGIAAAVVLVLHTVLLVASGVAVRRAYSDLRRAGRPMTAAEIIPPAVPDPENGALLYQSAFALLRAEPSGNDSLLAKLGAAASAYLDEPDAPARREAFEKLLAHDALAVALGLVERAAARPKCRFDVQYDQGAAMLCPHLGGLLAIGRLLPAKAILEAERGEAEQAWRTIETALRAADAVRAEPILISQLVRITQIRMAMKAIQAVSGKAMPDEAAASRIDATLAAMDEDSQFTLAVDGERLLMGEWAFDWARRARLRELLGSVSILGSGPPKLLVVLPVLYRPVFQADHAAYLRTMHGGGVGAGVPLGRVPAGEPEDEAQALPRYCILSRMLLPALSVARTRFGVAQAELRITRTGLALKRHKAAYGSYPSDLVSIAPNFLKKTPLDPFSGRPLVYRTEGDGFVLYSVGENRQDDGGKPEPTGEKKTSLSPKESSARAWDLVWRSEN